jgi:hypothetical protein
LVKGLKDVQTQRLGKPIGNYHFQIEEKEAEHAKQKHENLKRKLLVQQLLFQSVTKFIVMRGA